MRKALLVGNGFTLNLISQYNNYTMMIEFYKKIPEMITRIEQEFSVFRNSNFTRKDLFTISEATFCGDNLFAGSGVYASSDGIHFKEPVKKWIVDNLVHLGFDEPVLIYDEYFKDYGLIYLITEDKIVGIESYLKVVALFEKIGRFSIDEYNQIKNIANVVYFNNGDHGVASIDNNKIDIKKLENFITEFVAVFTTNYDTILDDLLMSSKRYPYHLHGGFSINHKNKDPDGRYSPNEAKLVWGISAEEKLDDLSSGLDYSDLYYGAFRYGQSRLSDYFDILGKGKYDEIHIIGFSGENDNHINCKIIDNPHITNIVYYANPNEFDTLEMQVRGRLLFSGERKSVNLKSWNEFWDKTYKN